MFRTSGARFPPARDRLALPAPVPAHSMGGPGMEQLLAAVMRNAWAVLATLSA